MPRRLVKLVRENQRVSMRLRLTLWIAAIFTVIQWGTSAVFWLYERSMIERFYGEMVSQQAAALTADVSEWLPTLTSDSLRQRVDAANADYRFDTFFVDVFDAAGNRVIQGGEPIVDPASLPIDDALAGMGPMRVHDPAWTRRFEERTDAGPLWAVLVPCRGTDGMRYAVLVATSDRFARTQMALVGQVLLTAGAITPMAMAVTAWFIAGFAVAPFLRLRELAKQFSPEHLNKSLEFESSNAEVAALAEQLDEARKNIHEAFAAQERFLSNVSHEIKTPIAVMRMEAQTLDLTGAPAEFTYFVGSVKEEMTRLGSLVESFLTLTRIQDGQGRVRGRLYAANDLVMDSVEHCAVMANQNRVWLRPHLFADDETIDTAVSGDPELLTTMVDNLIRNAIRFSPRNGAVYVDVTRDETRVRIAVRDEGPGIPEDKLSTIFDRFAQAGNEQRAGRGHGLGLAIAKGIAELHGGTIRVANRDEGGCLFEIELPRADNAPPDPSGTGEA